MNFRIAHAGLTDTGRVRAGNEDAWAADPGQGLYIVADGMGGHNAGEIAAQIVVDSLPRIVRTRLAEANLASPVGPGEPRATQKLVRRLKSAVSRVNKVVYEQAMAEPELYGMGATVVLALVRGAEAVVVHMGDSRAYLLRDEQLKLLTKDHSVVQALIDTGEITEAEAATHPERNRITASVGMPGSPSPDTKRVPLRLGDKLLLCSDGLANMVPDEQIAPILARPRPPAMVCQDLVDAANSAGGHDNITVVVIEVQEPVGADAGAASSG